MTVSYTGLLKASASAAILLTGLTVTACVRAPTEPIAVAASNPTITYVYHNDAELLQANDRAGSYCAQYQAGPHMVRYDSGPDGRIAVFECVQGGPVATTTTTVTTMPGPAAVGPAPVGYDSYYDDFYGPYYDGYWAADGFFYFTDAPGHAYRRDESHHFRRDMAMGFHNVHSSVVNRG